MQLSTNCDYSTIFKQLPTIISGINQLGEATNKLEAINFSVVGLNTGNIDAYRNAISGISKEQATLLLSTQGLNQAQIDLVLSNEKVTATEIAEASVLDNVAKKKSILTAEQQKQLISSNAITSEKLAEISATLGLETAENGSLVSKKALNAEMVKQQLQSIGIVGSTQTQIMSMLGLTTAETSAATASNILSGAMAKLSLAMSTNPIGALITVIGVAIASVYGLTKAFDALTDSAEEIDERVDNLISKYNDLKTTADNNASTIESLADEYESLSKGVNALGENISLTSDEYDRYNEIVNQIADMFPTLITGYTDEGTAILSLKGNVEQLRDAYKEAQQEAYNLLVATGKDSDGNDIMESYKNLSELDWWDSSIGAEDVTTTVKRDITKQILDLMSNMDTAVEEYDKLAQYIFDTYGDKGYNFLEEMGLPAIKDVFSDTSGITKEALIAGKATVQSYYQGFQSEIDTKLSNVKLMANAFLNTNDFYLDDSTNSELKNALSVIVNSLDEELANSFNGEKEKVGAYVNNIVNGIKDNEDAKKALTELFTLDTTDMPVNDIQSNVDSYISTIATAIGEDPVELKIRLGFDYVNELEAQQQRAVDFAKDKFDGYDPTAFFKENSINTQEEVDKWLEIAQAANSAADAEERYVQGSTLNNETPISFDYKNLEDLESSVSSIQSAYDTIIGAMQQYNEQGYLNMDTIDSLIALDDVYINKLIDENGQLHYNADTFKELARIKLEEAKASIYQEACLELTRIKELDTGLAAQELALANGTLTESAYNVAKALYKEITAMGGANAALAKNTWDAAQKKVALLDNQLKSVSTSTYNFAKASSSAKKDFSETIDFFKERVEKLNASADLLKTNLENVSGSFSKNTLIDAQIRINEESFENYTDALSMYTEKANTVLSKLPADLAEKVKNGAVELTTFMGEGNEEIVKTIKEYDTWADEIDNCNKKLAELKEAISKLELDKFKNIAQDFSDQFDIRENIKSNIDKQIELLEESGQMIGESFYTAKREQSEKQMDILLREKESLTKQLSSALLSGNIQKGTDEWLEMVNTLSDLDNSITDCKISVEKFNNAILEINTKIFDEIQKRFSNINSEISNFINLVDTYDSVTDTGEWTDQGLAQLGLLAQQFELAQYQVGQYDKRIEELTKAYNEGKYSSTEYSDMLAELIQGQWDAVNATESVKDAILELHKERVNKVIEGIEEEKEAYKKLIDAQIESLTKEKELHDYKNSLADKKNKIERIERQIAALEFDTSASANAQKIKLQEELVKARKELEELEYQHSVETQTDALNKEYENFESEKDSEIEKLEESLTHKEQLIEESFETIKQNSDIIGKQIADIANRHGITVSNAIINSWKNGENAIANYGSVLSAHTSSFIGQLLGVENEVYKLQTEANITANSLVSMFASSADRLINDLLSSYNSIVNVNAVTNALQNSLVNTLERGYNVNGITSALNSITNAANGAKTAMEDFLNSQHETPKSYVYEYTGAIKNRKKMVNVYTSDGNYVTTVSDTEAQKTYGAVLSKSISGKTIKAYAKGGIISKEPNGVFDQLAKSIGEDTFVAVKYGEGILSENQMDFLSKFSESLKQGKVFDISQNYSVPNLTPVLKPMVKKSPTDINIHYDHLVEFNGNVNDMNQISNTVSNMVKNANEQSWKEFGWECKKSGVW